MPLPLHAPNALSPQELNAQALAGSQDAARRLAAVSTKCKTVKQFVEKFVPDGELSHMVGMQDDGYPLTIFDLYADAFVWSRTPGAKRDTLVLPAVGQA